MQSRERDRRSGLMVDECAARQVAACFLASEVSSRDSLLLAAYAQLETQTDRLLRRVLRAWGPRALRIVSTAVANPYDSDRELIDSVDETATLEIPPVDRDRWHPLLDCQPGGSYDRFRALHDLLGHVVPRFGFDRDGEFAAWRAQHHHYRGLARWALATELHAQHSVRWTTGDLAELKATLIDRQLLRKSASGPVPMDV
jgi:hypothetical protein